MTKTVPMETPNATLITLEPLIRGYPPPPLYIDALVVILVDVDAEADEGLPFISGPNPAGPFGPPETNDVP